MQEYSGCCYVYILRSLRDGSYYKGYTTDIIRRFEEHNTIQGSYTAKFASWELVWMSKQKNKSEAMKLEKKLKNITSKIKLEDFIKRNKSDELDVVNAGVAKWQTHQT